MEALLILGLAVLGFLIAVPWAAFSSLARANRALALAAKQQEEIDQLRLALSALREARGETGQPETAAAAEAEDEAIATETLHRELARAEDPALTSEAAPQTTLATSAEPIAVAPLPADALAAEALALEQAVRTMELARHGEPETPQPDTIAAPDPVPAAPRRDFEEAIGSRWAVWVGGIALAFGGLFLVRYSIEAGVFGPGMRLLMGAAFSLVAAAASEYLRRSDRLADLGAMPGALGRLGGANIPAVLAGVSVLSGFGVVYGAHAIHGFIGPGLAFTLMGLIGLAALAASLLHGPVLGLFGLVGSYATPLLVASTAPNFPALSVFLALVTAVAFLIHAWQPSRVVTLGAIAGHGIWTALIGLSGESPTWSSLLLVVGAVLALVLLKEWPKLKGGTARSAWPVAGFDGIGLAAIATPLVLSGVLWTADGGPVMLHLAILTTVLVAILSAVRHGDLAPLAPLAAAAASGMVLLWPSVQGAFGLSPDIVLDIVSRSGRSGRPRRPWSS